MRRLFVVLLLLEARPSAAGDLRSIAEVLSPSTLADRAGESVVSLDTVVELARLKAPAIASARARLSRVQEGRRAATVFPDPVIRAGLGRGTPKDGGASGTESSVEIAQWLPSPWGLGRRREAGNAAIDAASQQVDAVVLDVVLQAKTLYYQATLGAARAAALSQAADDARSLSDLVGRRVAVGEAAGADHLRTQVEALRAQAEARAALAEAAGARAALNRFLLGALGSDFRLPTDLDPGILAPLPDTAVEGALLHNPAFRAAQSRVEAAKSAVAVERAARLPGLEVSAFSLNEIDRKAYGATLGIAIPLWNRNNPGVGIARAELSEAEAEANGVRASIESDVERLFSKDRAARENAIAYNAEILPAAREALAVVRNSLEQGEASLPVWLEARRSYLENLRASYEAQLNAFLTRAELLRLTGESNAAEK